jgi:hypothetical protein
MFEKKDEGFCQLFYIQLRALQSVTFGTCTVVSVNGTLIEDKMCTFKGQYAQFSFNKCPIYTDGGASDKFSTNSHEPDNNEYVSISANNTLTLTHLCKKKITFQTCYVAPNCWMVQGVHFTDKIHIRYLPFIPA